MRKKGTHFSPKTEFKKGQIPWNKGKKTGNIWKGRAHSEEAKQKMREAHLGKSAGMLGKKHSEESKRKMSEALKGKVPWIIGKHHSEDARQKMSVLRKGRIPWNKGKSTSEKTKKKLSEIFKGKPARNKGLKTGKPAWNRGLHPSEETLKKLSESHKGQDHWTGRKHSEESKQKMSIRHKTNPIRYWQGKKRPDIIASSRETLMRLYKSGAFPKQSNTLPERMIKKELISRGHTEGIDFIHQGNLGEFIPDFYFPIQKVIVECDGDYWHANPKKHPYNPLTYINTKTGKPLHPEKQVKNIKDDAKKNYYYSKLDNGSWKVIRLWESEIKRNVKECVDKIEAMLKE
ncbi:MAG: NUMOD3 domain-containing DNA-binding protein [Candidatus Woesearchaeota archaeon]